MILKYIVLILIFLFCSCKDELKYNNDQVNAVVTIPPYRNFVKMIGGVKINVISIIPQSGNPHTFEPTPRQLKSMNFSDIYFKVGGSFEFEKIWLSKFESNWKIIDCSDDINQVDNDPHIWLSPANAKTILLNIYKGLAELIPSEEDYFKANYESYYSQLDSLDNLIKQRLEDINNRDIMVYHPAWRYFAEHYNFSEITIEKEGKGLNAADLAQTIELAKSKKINIIFVDPKFQSSNAKTIANEIGAELIEVNPTEENYIMNLDGFSKILRKHLN